MFRTFPRPWVSGRVSWGTRWTGFGRSASQYPARSALKVELIHCFLINQEDSQDINQPQAMPTVNHHHLHGASTPCSWSLQSTCHQPSTIAQPIARYCQQHNIKTSTVKYQHVVIFVSEGGINYQPYICEDDPPSTFDLRHPALVVAVHQPDEGGRVWVGRHRRNHLASRPVECSELLMLLPFRLLQHLTIFEEEGASL